MIFTEFFLVLIYFKRITICWFKIKFDQNEATKAYLTLNLKNPF